MTLTRTHRMLLGAAVCALMTGVSASARFSAHAAGTLPLVTVTAVYNNNSNAKIDYNPVRGALDYRILDVSNATEVKYAGRVHLDAGPFHHFVMQPGGVTPVFPYTSTNNLHGSGPQTLDVPSTEIQWNVLDDGRPHTLIVQALDLLGPVPPANLVTFGDNAVFPPGGFLGTNQGPTPDGNTSINGQGSYSNTVHVIAQSQPFVVQANKLFLALPSMPNAVQTFFDTFDSSEAGNFQQTGPINPFTGVMTYTLNAGTTRAWDILYHNADTNRSTPFIMDGHFMDVLFDGITPSSLPAGHWYDYHTQYSSMSLSPQTSADLSGGKLLHLTMEVDSHLESTHRWLAWQLAPANDPLTNMVADDAVTNMGNPGNNKEPINNSDKGLWVQLFPQMCDAMLFEGRTSPTNPVPITDAFIPQLVPGQMPPCYRSTNWGGNGVGLDNRERWDLFLTTSHMALFENGQLIKQADIPDGGLPFTQAKVYFTHYLYSTQEEHKKLPAMAPYEKYWIDVFPYSDERHWDNMGFEVLPASAVPSDWSTLSSLIHMPAATPPSFVP